MPQNKIHFDNERTDAVNIGFEEEIISENNGSLNDNGKSLAATDLTDKTNLNGSFNKYLIICILVAVAGSTFQCGYQGGMFNIPEKNIKDFINETYAERNDGQGISEDSLTLIWSLCNGLVPIGGIFGAAISGFVADKFGRKKGLMLVNILVAISAVLFIISKFIKSYETILVARFIAGVYNGFFSGILPIYLNEIAPPNLRGLVGTVNQFSVVLSILVANILSLEAIFGSKELWPLLVGFILVPGLFNIALIFFVESPKYLYCKGNIKGAKLALEKLRGIESETLVANEIASYEEEKTDMLNQKELSWSDFYKLDYLRRPLIVTIVLQMSQQLSGINAAIFYSTEIFKSAGIDNEVATICSILLNVVNLLMTFVCMVLVDRAGRRILMLIGLTGMCLSATGLALFIVISDQYQDSAALSVITIAFAVGFIIFFAIGPGAIPWLITGELFDSSARAKAGSIACFTNWFFNALVTFLFPIIQASIGSYSFFIFSFFLVIFSLFVTFFVPETKNKSIEEIKTIFRNHYIFFSLKYF